MALARVLVVDPPWKFSDSKPGGRPGAEKHYQCMTVNQILRMELPPIADDAVLFLWRVSSMVEEAYRVIRAWDFVPKSEVVWNKTDETGEKDAMGLGHIVRGSHETAIVATRGKKKIETASKRERTSFRAPKGQHSEKPEKFYQLVERLYPLELWPEAHVELFARKRRKGWIQYGNELPPIVPCLLHGEPSHDCKECAIVAASVNLKTEMAKNAVVTNGHGTRRTTTWDAIRARLAEQAREEKEVEGGAAAP